MVRCPVAFRRAVRSCPRTRGDGPTTVPPTNSANLLSPHTRGWSVIRLPIQQVTKVVPAHAGMVRLCRRMRPKRTRCPRTRGDGPSVACSASSKSALSPHTRGWSERPQFTHIIICVVPAHAGMVLRSIPRYNDAASCPRTRGDGPMVRLTRGLISLLSPHTRGWSDENDEFGGVCRVVPAYAGMVRIFRSAGRSRRRCPRTRGDGPYHSHPPTWREALSPHARGWSVPSPHRTAK